MATAIRNVFTSNLSDFQYVNSKNVCENTAKEFSLEEIADHDSVFDCWIVVYDRIYDISKMINEHPGGADVLLEYAGRDATLAFRSTGHSTFAIDSLEKYYVGSLPLHQRLFRKPDGIILSNMPE